MKGASPAVSVVDLGLGNLRSVLRAFERVGAVAELVQEPEQVHRAERIVVPGQGAFRDCARALVGGMGEALTEAIEGGTPYLGICLGMQLLFETSEEAPEERGLGLFPGHVVRFAADLEDPETGARLKVPHMGWNQVRGEHRLLPPDAWLYFVHSYHCVPETSSSTPTPTVGVADYGAEFCAAVARDNVFACQFHPEKSHHEGEFVVRRFLEEA